MGQRESPLDKIRKMLMWFGQLVRQEITSKGIILPCEGNTELVTHKDMDGNKNKTSQRTTLDTIGDRNR